MRPRLSGMIYLLCLCSDANLVATAMRQHEKATIKALGEQTIYLPATSDSYTVVLEYFPKPTQLNISQVGFQTIARLDYCQTNDNDSNYCSVPSWPTETAVPRYLRTLLLHLPPDCIKDSTGKKCDWNELGIGGQDVCCTLETHQQGAHHQQGSCQHLDLKKFLGNEERSLKVPKVANEAFLLGDRGGIFAITEAGEYAFVMANCNEHGWDLLSLPRYVGESDPPYLQGLVYYYASLTLYHTLLFLAYIFALIVMSDFILPIQKWLATTMAMEALDVLFICINCNIWDLESESWFNVYTISVTIGVLKRGISMCVGVMLAKGWGAGRTVTSHSGNHTLAIGMLGVLYTGILFVHKISNASGESNLMHETMSRGADSTASTSILYFIVAVLDVVFAFWMLLAVRATIVLLKSASRYEQVSYHRRFAALLAISLFAITPAWVVQLVDKFQSIPMTEAEWSYMNATCQGIYSLTLTAVAALWISNRTCQEECMEMKELYCENLHGDSQDAEHDLGLEEEARPIQYLDKDDEEDLGLEEEPRPVEFSDHDNDHLSTLPIERGHLL